MANTTPTKELAWDSMLTQSEEKLTIALENESFAVLSVEYAVKTDDGAVCPCEVAAAPMTIDSGVDPAKIYHSYPKPCIPFGYGAMAKEHAETTHELWASFNKFSAQYDEIVAALKNVVELTDKKVFVCLLDEVPVVTGALTSLLNYAGRPKNYLPGVIAAESFLIGPAKNYPPESLKRSTFDYCPAMRCDYHSQKDIYHCSRAKILRLCFNIMNTLGKKSEIRRTLNSLKEYGSGGRMTGPTKLGKWKVPRPYCSGARISTESAAEERQAQEQPNSLTSPLQQGTTDRVKHRSSTILGPSSDEDMNKAVAGAAGVADSITQPACSGVSAERPNAAGGHGGGVPFDEQQCPRRQFPFFQLAFETTFFLSFCLL